jgi:hypothetical protein
MENSIEMVNFLFTIGLSNFFMHHLQMATNFGGFMCICYLEWDHAIKMAMKEIIFSIEWLLGVSWCQLCGYWDFSFVSWHLVSYFKVQHNKNAYYWLMVSNPLTPQKITSPTFDPNNYALQKVQTLHL